MRLIVRMVPAKKVFDRRDGRVGWILGDEIQGSNRQFHAQRISAIGACPVGLHRLSLVMVG